MLGLAGSRKRDLALGQLCFCWAGRSKFLFLTHYETREQHRSNLCRGGESCFSLSCPSSAKEGGLTPPAPSPGGEGAFSWAGLDAARVFLGVCQGISSWHCCWPEEYKISIFSQGSCPAGVLCSVVQRNISKGPFLLQASRKESQRQPGCE